MRITKRGIMEFQLFMVINNKGTLWKSKYVEHHHEVTLKW